MRNLKITVELDSSVILNRYLTIDNILLFLHFNKLKKEGKIHGFIDTEKFIQKNKNNLFLDYKNGVLSGSIWYLEKNTPIWIENHIFTKKVPVKEIKKAIGKIVDTSRGEFKSFIFGFEALRIPSLYFYVRGDKKYIEELLKDLKFIGKKSAAGFGQVKKLIVEEIEADKSFMLDEFTPVKPLPVNNWKVKTKKVAFYRTLPPYYIKKDIEACYMPTRALIEIQDRSYFDKNFEYLSIPYISATKFAIKHQNKFPEYPLFGKVGKKVKYINDKEHRCIVCGSMEKEGLLGNPKHFLPPTFNDYAFLDEGNFICVNCLWTMKQIKNLPNTLITENNIVYLQGSNMKIKSPVKQKEFRSEFFTNLDKLKPPFLISLKSTQNAQHTVFKNKVAISNAMVPISYGTEEEHLIDVELLKNAIEETKEILEKYPCIKKVHLYNTNEITQSFFKLSKKCMDNEHIKVVQDFWKKYDRSIRKVLNRIII